MQLVGKDKDFLGEGIVANVVLVLAVDVDRGTIRRRGLSSTAFAAGGIGIGPRPFFDTSC